MAKKKDEKTLWIQATMNTSMKKKKEKLRTIPWNLEGDCVQFWIKRSPGKTDVYELNVNGEFYLIGKILNRHFYSAVEGEIQSSVYFGE